MALTSPLRGVYKNPSAKFVTLKSLRNLRSWFRDASSEDVQDVIEQLERLKREKTREEDERTLRLNRQEELCEQYTKLEMQSNFKGQFDPQDILDALIDRLSCRSRRYRSARVKYRYYDLQGNLCEWSGQGREPIKLRELLEATGKSRDDFLVTGDEDTGLVLTSSTTEERLSRSIEQNQDHFALNEVEFDKDDAIEWDAIHNNEHVGS